MKKNNLLILAVVLAIISFASTSFAWQGRMSGMGDPFGLVSDESDLLVHPAKIVDGNGSNYYVDYKFNYVQVSKWNNTFSYNPAIEGATQYPFMAKGSERDHAVSLGGTWAFGPGRLGLFLQYSTEDGSFNGSDNNGTDIVSHDTFSFDPDSRSFDLKLIYGLPLGSWKLGTELAFAHKTIINSTSQFLGAFGETATNDPIGARDPFFNIFPYGVPADLRWREASFKISAEKTIGPGVLTFTPRIATVIHGTSDYTSRFQSGSFILDDIDGTGNLTGWSTGADLWYRVKLNDTTTLPFVVRANYDRKRADISAYDSAAVQPIDLSSEAKQFVFEAGGGIDKNISKETKIASGLYYNYLQGKTMFMYDYINESNYIVANNETPLEKENRIVLKAVCEHIFSPAVTARAGINAFYGWVRDRYDFINTLDGLNLESQDLKTSGHRWGVTASAGTTLTVARLSIEPFINGGLQKTKLDNSSGSFTPPATTVSLQSAKSEWNIGGGVSIKY